MVPLCLTRIWFLVALVSVALCGCGKDRTNDVVGVWDWDSYAVHFDADKSWGATDKQRSTHERMGGTWSVSGDQVTLEYTGSNRPSPVSSVFDLNADGITMEASVGAVGTMKKRLAPASLDVK